MKEKTQREKFLAEFQDKDKNETVEFDSNNQVLKQILHESCTYY